MPLITSTESLFDLFIYCVVRGRCIHQSAHLEVRGQPADFLLPPYGSQGLNLDLETWQQASFFAFLYKVSLPLQMVTKVNKILELKYTLLSI